MVVGWAFAAWAGVTVDGDPTTYATLQEAVDAAPPGGVVRAEPGTYAETVTVNADLTIVGAGEGLTVIDAPGNGLRARVGALIWAQDLTIRATADAVQVSGGADLTLERVSIDAWGGLGIICASGAVTTVSAVLRDGPAPAVDVSGSCVLARFEDTIFSGIHAVGVDGAAIVGLDGAIEISGGLFTDLSADRGGAIAVTGGSLLVEGAVIDDVFAANEGGFLYAVDAVVALEDSAFLEVESGSDDAAYLIDGTLELAGGTYSDGAPPILTFGTDISASNTELSRAGRLLLAEGGNSTFTDVFFGPDVPELTFVDVASLRSTRSQVCRSPGSRPFLSVFGADEIVLSNDVVWGTPWVSVGGLAPGDETLTEAVFSFTTAPDVRIEHLTALGVDVRGAVIRVGTGTAISVERSVFASLEGVGAAVAGDGVVAGTDNVVWASDAGLLVGALDIDPMPVGGPLTSLFCDPDYAWWPKVGSGIVDALGDAGDVDGSLTDLGASGGPQAHAFLYADGDGDSDAFLRDCDDSDDTVGPSAVETCNDRDDDCNDLVDDDPIDLATLCEDADGDGFGAADGATALACFPFDDFVEDCSDCQEGDPAVPGVEVCGGGDEDCDGLVDDLDASVDPASQTAWYEDGDADGYGAVPVVVACVGPDGSVAVAGDCDDTEADVSPGAFELCAAGDEDCDGLAGDEDDPIDPTIWYADADNDGFGGLFLADACEAPPGSAAVAGDCDDLDPATHPSGLETCSAGDEDCDGLFGDADPDVVDGVAWYEDNDEDGAGGALLTVACEPPAWAVAVGDDCDDFDANLVPGAIWYVDADGDGVGGAEVIVACSPPAGAVADAGDCDDGDPDIGPHRPETCGGGDEDCDGLVDDEDPTVTGLTPWYVDADHDGFGAGEPALFCLAPADLVTLDGDCGDGDPTIHPGAAERCGGGDDDCDGEVDEDVLDAPVWFADVDEDGFGGVAVGQACDAPVGAVGVGGDCDDTDDASSPASTEVCGGADEDCDGEFDDDDTSLDPASLSSWFVDGDGDGVGGDLAALSCAPPDGAVSRSGDCDDARSDIGPDAAEVCNGVDEDCDGWIDDEDPSLDLTSAPAWLLDLDVDGFGGAVAEAACAVPGAVLLAGDCDDLDPDVSPVATEVCGGVDEDCDGLTDASDPSLDGTTLSTFAIDGDGDGYAPDGVIWREACTPNEGEVALGGDCDDGMATVFPGATEFCNGLDDDCDAVIDGDLAVDKVGFYGDVDGDGRGDPNAAVYACDLPTGAAELPDDCNDAEPLAWTGADEVCDDVDNDCDGVTDPDDALDASLWYADEDDDGFGAEGSGEPSCAPIPGRIATVGDCDDSDAAVHPGAEEVAGNGVDEDCDGTDVPAETLTEDTGGDGTGFDGDPPKECGCTAAPAGGSAWLAALLLALGRRRAC